MVEPLDLVEVVDVWWRSRGEEGLEVESVTEDKLSSESFGATLSMCRSYIGPSSESGKISSAFSIIV